MVPNEMVEEFSVSFSDDGSMMDGRERAQEDNGDDQSVVKNEDRALSWIRFSLTLALLVSLVVVAGLVFHFSRTKEINHFEANFYQYATEVVESIEAKVNLQLAAAESLAAAITSFAYNERAEWPMVTVADFDRLGGNTRKLADTLSVLFAPFVTDEEREHLEKLSGTPWFREIRPGEVIIVDDQEQLSRSSTAAAESKAAPYQYAPLIQASPALPTSLYNQDMLQDPNFRGGMELVMSTEKPSYTGMFRLGDDSDGPSSDVYMAAFANIDAQTSWYSTEPLCVLFSPIFNRFGNGATLSGALGMLMYWRTYFTGPMHPGVSLFCVINGCTKSTTFQLAGGVVEYIGQGDHHDRRFDKLRHSADLPFFEDGGDCPFTLTVYPTQQLKDEYITAYPVVNALLIAFLFIGFGLLFAAYDRFLLQRHQVLVKQFRHSTALISSLFPKSIRDRLLMQPASRTTSSSSDTVLTETPSAETCPSMEIESKEKASLKTACDSRPIAELYLKTSVLFADLAGFTSWASMRDPAQVFILLETIYGEFDKIAVRRGVFKVETIGDCYLAVTGCPEPQENHAVIMVKFAQECLVAMQRIVQRLETKLGPDTSALNMRVGIHSGPVTAGVLRGQRSRFQLFGDTVNTAARMESKSLPGKIQISKQTATLLEDAGKSKWITPRDALIEAKGLGTLQTYWVKRPTSMTMSQESSCRSLGTCDDMLTDEAPSKAPILKKTTVPARMMPSRKLLKSQRSMKWSMPPTLRAKASEGKQRLVEWSVAMISSYLKKVVAQRQGEPPAVFSSLQQCIEGTVKDSASNGGTKTVLDEFTSIIELPEFTPKAAHFNDDIELSSVVVNQLRQLVTTIASMYRPNPFHNFEHACHVTQSICKLLKRVVKEDGTADMAELHEHTYGLSSDPLTQFAVVLSALIHDLDHSGVPNAQLIKEEAHIAKVYREKSVAEQNSLDIAWDLLMDPSFQELHETIFTTEKEFERFRRVLVNCVLATDICDKELSGKRKDRWNIAFDEEVDRCGKAPEENKKAAMDRKATIVLEHIIQASDVSHTMQHWDVYLKWNRHLFNELYSAFKSGRTDTDPSSGWYKGEIGFFDFYIIPLAKKLHKCGVFGVSSEEYLCFAISNRDQWEREGERLVEDYIASHESSLYTARPAMGGLDCNPKPRRRRTLLIEDDEEGE